MTGRYVVMGVCGCGKSTIAGLLAERTGGTFLDADDFHPEENKEKMAKGIPLTDTDRWPWLTILNTELKKYPVESQPVFLACSALKEDYRTRLAIDLQDLRFIFLRGTRECILTRMQQRQDHFMPVALLDSQLATLEEPGDAIVLDIEEPIPCLIEEALEMLEPIP